jgi:proteic killer suppression protein
MQVKIYDDFLVEVATGTHGKLPFPSEVAIGFRKRLVQINQAESTQDLRNLKSLHFEKLKGKRYEDKYSIRINQSYRIIFHIDKHNGVEIIGIEEISNHYST